MDSGLAPATIRNYRSVCQPFANCGHGPSAISIRHPRTGGRADIGSRGDACGHGNIRRRGGSLPGRPSAPTRPATGRGSSPPPRRRSPSRAPRRRWTTSPPAPASGVGTLYRHFATKDALMVAMVGRKFEQILAGTQAAWNDGGRTIRGVRRRLRRVRRSLGRRGGPRRDDARGRRGLVGGDT